MLGGVSGCNLLEQVADADARALDALRGQHRHHLIEEAKLRFEKLGHVIAHRRLEGLRLDAGNAVPRLGRA